MRKGFRYQHVGIPNVKFSRWWFRPTQGPNASGFATQWNLGLAFGFNVPKWSRQYYRICNEMQYSNMALETTALMMHDSNMFFQGGGLLYL